MPKNYISLSFADTGKLQIVQFDRNKNKVEKYLTVDLPDGLIVKHKVDNQENLSKILKGAWQKLKIKEKFVGIVVPEFSTYVKTITIPKLIDSELDEAIKWQAQEYLPIDINEVSLDWKIINKSQEITTVMVVCIDKRILSSYVQSAAEAGLYPLIVETPSLSLLRIGLGESGKLIIYRMSKDAIFVMKKGEEIFGSSSHDISDFTGVTTLAKRMINHYKDSDVTDIEVGGFEFDSKLETLLQKETGKKVRMINLNCLGLSQAKIQEYLIPISLQMSEPTVPSNRDTINLLPADLVTYYSYEKLKSQSWSLTFVAGIIVWSVFVAVAVAYLFILNQLNSFKKENSSRGNIVEETKDITNQIFEYNSLFDKVLKISSASTVFGNVLNDIYSAAPTGVTIDSYKINYENGVVELLGLSIDRLSLVNFKQNLEKNEKVSNINIPISSLEVVSNLEFSVKLNYDFGVVKPSPPLRK